MRRAVFLASLSALFALPARANEDLAALAKRAGKDYQPVSQSAFPARMDDRFKNALIRGDFNGDGVKDLVLLLLNAKAKKAAVFLYLGKKTGGFEAPVLLREQPLLRGELDLMIQTKPRNEAGIADLPLFSSVDPKRKEEYTAAKAVEIGFQELHCTQAFFFSQGKLTSESACD